ncbi:hypothetical protein BD410DRAFT_846875 [Rickenella mellea]|uniref:Uncharacterized protein n=1 Tax=Rickenella mellea TaxID=50990 RepID=A0A4Y7PG76_9AGAM|nr:hypothetical protein BD410DRAFT_846875 [Rickenella mellea]
MQPVIADDKTSSFCFNHNPNPGNPSATGKNRLERHVVTVHTRLRPRRPRPRRRRRSAPATKANADECPHQDRYGPQSKHPGTSANSDVKALGQPVTAVGVMRQPRTHPPLAVHTTPDAGIGAGLAGRTERPRAEAGRADASESEAKRHAAGWKGA